MKKKIFTLFFALVASVGTMFASDTQVDGIWYNFDNGNLTAEVTYQGNKSYSYSDEYSGEVVIPASVTYNAQTYPVTSIGNGAFSGCSGLTSVTIPNSVTSIGGDAFSDCTGLTSVTIPNSVTSIGSSAFYCCTGLTSVTIPNSVTSIGSYTFYGCSGLTSVTIPNSVTSIGNYAFYGCSGLTSVTIPNSVTSIGMYAFSRCTRLTSPVYNTHVFAYMPTSYSGAYTILDSIESIADGAFSGCTGLTSVTIPNSVTSIGSGAFYGCTGLTSVTIGNSVTSIGEYAFQYCSGLTSVTIPNSVTSIGKGAFWGCTGLTSITCEAITPPTLGSNVFSSVNTSIPLYVPAESLALYKAADQWKDFENIVGVDVPGEDPVDTIPGNYSIYYVDKENQELSDEVVTLHVPVAPIITDFTFLKWVVVNGDLDDGITIQAVYQADEPSSAPAVYTNPANPAQKLIKNGNVYILTDDKTYTLTGQEVK